MAVGEQVEFSLTELVRGYIRVEDEPEPREIARRIAAELEVDLLREVARETLPHLVRREIGKMRGEYSSSRREGRSRWEVNPDPRWREKLNIHIHTADGYKRLWNCTADDLGSAIEEYRAQAAAINAKVTVCSWFRDAVKHHAVGKVGDLPEALLQELVAEHMTDRPR